MSDKPRHTNRDSVEYQDAFYQANFAIGEHTSRPPSQEQIAAFLDVLADYVIYYCERDRRALFMRLADEAAIRAFNHAEEP